MRRKLKAHRFQEVASGNGHYYLFSATLGNIEAFTLDPEGCDVALFSAELVCGQMPIGKIRALLTHTLINVDGKEDFDIDFEVKRFLEDMGLEDCASFCTLLLSHLVAGSVKKNREKRRLKFQHRMFLILTNIKKYGLKLAVILTILAISVCMNFNLLLMHFVKLTT